MKIFLHFLFSIVCFLIAFIGHAENKRQFGDFVPDTVINIFSSWRAVNKYAKIKKEYSTLAVVSEIDPNLPDEFDLRTRWSNCPTIGEINDQASCGSCWAMSAVDAMTDRYCIHSKGKYHFRFSANNVLSCCHQCGSGCHGGTHRSAWKYWVENGIVSGGPKGSNNTCQPYQFEPCEHHVKGPRSNCTKYNYTPQCEHVCQPGYKVPYKKDIRYGLTAYSISSNEKAIRTEIYRHGSVQASIRMYKDFHYYKSGVYQHRKGKFIYDHAVRIIGWGVDNKTNNPYWIVANTFNTDWGNKGFVYFKRGTNECNIEKDVTGGIPIIAEYN